jgi:hypothetical protein
MFINKEKVVKYLPIIFLVLFLSACVTVPVEGLKTSINTGGWDIGYQKDFGAGNGYIREFVPKGESINNWSKLITIEFIEGEKSSLKTYIDSFQKLRTKQCPGTKFTLLDENEFDITYQFNFPTCGEHQQQSEISRLYAGNDGIHRLSYAEKTEEIPEPTVNKWLSEFDKSFIVKGPNAQPIR